MVSSVQQKGGINFTVNGESVTQLTSKATGVTIDSLTGQITLHNAALAAAAEVSFIVTNRLVDLRDIIVLSMESFGTPNSYLFTISAQSVGTFTISLSNVSAGSLAQALVLNYAIIKGVVRPLVLKDKRGQFNFTVNGGSVTQITNKGTGVTINRIVGQITTNNASLLAGVEITFLVTNSQCSLRDVVILSMESGGTVAGYAFAIGAIAEGSFNITIANLSAGTLSEALVLNYAIIKGVPRGTIHH